MPRKIQQFELKIRYSFSDYGNISLYCLLVGEFNCFFTIFVAYFIGIRSFATDFPDMTLAVYTDYLKSL